MNVVARTNSTPAVELAGITKAYPGVVANECIDLSLSRGEVHVLLGENGAGKSTLIGILSGMVTPDSGEIFVDGEKVEIRAPRDSLLLGIGTVYQHSLLVPTLSVLDNMLLGTTKRLTLDLVGARERLTELSGLLDVDLDRDSIVGDLALGQRQQVEIVRALWRGERALILDEPTSMLTPQGVEALRRVVRRLAEQGLAVVFITHKLDEALNFGDRVTVLRRGRKVGELTPSELSGSDPADLKRQIIDMIFGTAVGTSDSDDNAATNRRRDPTVSVCFELDGVSLIGDGPRPLLDSVSFRLERGEIFGIAGIDGNGQKELAEVIAGQRRLDAGTIMFEDTPVHQLSVAKRIELGIRYVTDDRHGEGTVGELSVALNTVLKRVGHRPFWRNARIRHSAIREFATSLIAEHDVLTPNELVPIHNLSGGNTQKVVVARELTMEPKVVVYNKPTYGLDVRTAEAVLDRIVTQAGEGTTTVLISTELSELIFTCDRIGVMYEGRLTGILESRAGIETELGEYMTGAGSR